MLQNVFVLRKENTGGGAAMERERAREGLCFSVCSDLKYTLQIYRRACAMCVGGDVCETGAAATPSFLIW